jgi:hypothetical protein
MRWDPATLTPTVYRDTCSSTHSGIGITFGGQIVNPSYRQQTVTFFTYDQNTNTITQTGCVNCPGLDPYNYNDFTGALLRYRAERGHLAHGLRRRLQRPRLGAPRLERLHP